MANVAGRERWAFIADWTDPGSGVRWTYQLFAYLPEQDAAEAVEIEMFDIKSRRHFIKRVKCDSVKCEQLFVGSVVNVFARHLHLISYGDEATRRAVEARAQRTLALILPDAAQQHTGSIMNAVYQSGFSIINMRMCQLSATEASTFLAAQQSSPLYPALVSLLASGPVVAMELMAASGVRKWLDILGELDKEFGTPLAGAVRKAALGSPDVETAAEELAFFFGSSVGGGGGAGSVGAGGYGSSLTGSSRGTSAAGGHASTSTTCSLAQVRSCCRGCGTTLGLILPHAVKDGVAGLMVQDIQSSAFTVTGLQLFNLPKQAAAEFLEVYKGVVPPGEFSGMVDELVSGPCIAVEVAARDGREPVEAFRQLVGPRDPELARVLRPTTLRARFGITRQRHAIHCTDLPEDSALETSYFFSVLQQQQQPATTAF